MCKAILSHANSKYNLPMSILIQVNILLLDNKVLYVLFITDFMTVAETVDIVAK